MDLAADILKGLRSTWFYECRKLESKHSMKVRRRRAKKRVTARNVLLKSDFGQ